MGARLQMPIIRWACAAVCLLDIDLRNPRIVLNHLKTAVSHQRLQREHVSTRAEVRDRKGMAESMRIAFNYFRFAAERMHQLAQAIFVELMIELRQKHGGFGIVGVLAFGKIAPQCASGGFPEKRNASLAAFGASPDTMFHFKPSGLLIVVANRQRTKFIGSQSRVKQCQDNRAISLGSGAPHREFSALLGLGFVAELARLDQRFNLFFLEWLDGRLLEPGCGNLLHRIGQVELRGGPFEESGKRRVGVADGFGGQWTFSAAKPSRFIFRPQPGEMLQNVGRGEAINFEIARMGEPQSEDGFVAHEGVWAECFGCLVLDEPQDSPFEFQTQRFTVHWKTS